MSTAVLPSEAPWRSGLRSARANLLPGLVLQLLALSLVLAYYGHDGTRSVLTRLADWRREVGLISSVFTTACFGGLLPWLYLRWRGAPEKRYSVAQGFALTLFWAYKGVEVDLFYRLLANVVGEGHDVATIATKTAIDQIIYCPLLAVPVTVVFYEWVAEKFRTDVVRADMRVPGWIRRRVVPVLISNLSVWLPAVIIIYTLPTPLQLPLQNLVLCFYTLLVAHQTQRAV